MFKNASLFGLVRRFFEQPEDADALRQGEDFPYFVQAGFSDDFVRKENSLCARDREGIIVRDAAGHAVLDCMCGNNLCGRATRSSACCS